MSYLIVIFFHSSIQEGKVKIDLIKIQKHINIKKLNEIKKAKKKSMVNNITNINAVIEHVLSSSQAENR